jgi:hypothetical protein
MVNGRRIFQAEDVQAINQGSFGRNIGIYHSPWNNKRTGPLCQRNGVA